MSKEENKGYEALYVRLLSWLVKKMSKVTPEIEELIKKKWQDISNPYSFSGLLRFQKFLKREEGITINRSDLYNILSQIPSFLTNQIKHKRFQRRQIDVSGKGSNNDQID